MTFSNVIHQKDSKAYEINHKMINQKERKRKTESEKTKLHAHNTESEKIKTDQMLNYQ